ncbi:MATE family efflux transporter [Solihabitans fulvus]|uniref:MATE family efflux transporter n=1 Tax=Solihabitans fulvus TaxID=1892852 RepID=UPI001661B19D|nr:MATE family efflux transporter [Solihabitans fulvus]
MTTTRSELGRDTHTLRATRGQRESPWREARIIWAPSLTVSITFLAQLCISLVETSVVSRLGPQQLAGVGIASGIYVLFFLLAIGTVTSLTPLVSEAYGRADRAGMRKIAHQGLIVAAVAGTILALVLQLFAPLILRLIASHETMEFSLAYLRGAALGLPFWAMYVAVRCISTAVGKSGVGTIVLWLSVPAHAALCLVLSHGTDWIPARGTFGAGIALAATPMISLMAVWTLLRLSKIGVLAELLRLPISFDRRQFVRVLSLGTPFAFRIAIREGVLPIAMLIAAPHGILVVTVQVVMAKLSDWGSSLGLGVATAVSSRIGYLDGSGARNKTRIAIAGGALCGILYGLLLCAGLMFFGGELVTLLVGTELSRNLGSTWQLVWPVAAWLFIICIQSSFVGAQSGLRDGTGGLVCVLLGEWMIGLPSAYLLANALDSTVVGIWLGLLIGETATLAIYWIRIEVILNRSERNAS